MNKRRITQIISLVILHSSFWEWAQLKWLCVPVLSCHSCPLAWFACPLGVFVHAAGYRVFPFLAVGTILVAGAVFARFLCGWICPFGLLQDLLFKIPTPKFRLPAWTSKIKYAVLLFMVFLIPFFLGVDTNYSFCRICPAAALQATLPGMVDGSVTALSTITWIKLGFLVFVLLLVTFSNRSFCKVFCPMGALLAPFNLITFWKMKPPTTHCVNCKLCDKVCPQDGRPSERILEGGEPHRTLDCMYCYDCREVCPVKAKEQKKSREDGVHRKKEPVEVERR